MYALQEFTNPRVSDPCLELTMNESMNVNKSSILNSSRMENVFKFSRVEDFLMRLIWEKDYLEKVLKNSFLKNLEC